jgi:hypothetical protein
VHSIYLRRARYGTVPATASCSKRTGQLTAVQNSPRSSKAPKVCDANAATAYVLDTSALRPTCSTDHIF